MDPNPGFPRKSNVKRLPLLFKTPCNYRTPSSPISLFFKLILYKLIKISENLLLTKYHILNDTPLMI